MVLMGNTAAVGLPRVHAASTVEAIYHGMKNTTGSSKLTIKVAPYLPGENSLEMGRLFDGGVKLDTGEV